MDFKVQKHEEKLPYLDPEVIVSDCALGFEEQFRKYLSDNAGEKLEFHFDLKPSHYIVVILKTVRP